MAEYVAQYEDVAERDDDKAWSRNSGWGSYKEREQRRAREAPGGHGVCHCEECTRCVEEFLGDSDGDVEEWN